MLLSAPVEVLVERVSGRSDNPYGHSPREQAEMRTNVVEVEPLLRAGAGFELDGGQPVSELADLIERIVSTAPR